MAMWTFSFPEEIRFKLRIMATLSKKSSSGIMCQLIEKEWARYLREEVSDKNLGKIQEQALGIVAEFKKRTLK